MVFHANNKDAYHRRIILNCRDEFSTVSCVLVGISSTGLFRLYAYRVCSVSDTIDGSISYLVPYNLYNVYSEYVVLTFFQTQKFIYCKVYKRSRSDAALIDVDYINIPSYQVS